MIVDFPVVPQIPHGPGDHRGSAVAVGRGGRCPCCGTCRFLCCRLEVSVEFPQLQFVEKSLFPDVQTVCSPNNHNNLNNQQQKTNNQPATNQQPTTNNRQPTTNNQQACPFSCVDLHRKTLAVDMDVERASGAAWRRRQRRLRSWWRDEQQTVAAVLATVTHHSHSKVGTANAALRGQKLGTSTEVGPAEYFELSSDDGRPTGVERPAALLEPWPQGKIERHDGIAYELVQALDAPVLQTVEQLQLPNVVQFFAAQLPVVAEPVIEVPKILPHDVPSRRLCRDTQLAEQLVEVPTTISNSSLQRTMEQNVDIPVPGGGGRNARLQSSLPEQSSTAPLSSSERLSERNVEQIVGSPGGGLQDFRPGQSSSSSSHIAAGILGDADEPGKGFFALFP